MSRFRGSHRPGATTPRAIKQGRIINNGRTETEHAEVQRRVAIYAEQVDRGEPLVYQQRPE